MSDVTKAPAVFGAEDAAWWRSFGGADSAVPPVRSEAQAQEYRRREAALRAAVADLGYSERGASAEGRLAAAIGARVADWEERDEEGGE